MNVGLIFIHLNKGPIIHIYLFQKCNSSLGKRELSKILKKEVNHHIQQRINIYHDKHNRTNVKEKNDHASKCNYPMDIKWHIQKQDGRF